MSDINDCLSTIIGLTDTTCECYENIPADAYVSDSGLYLSDYLPLQVVNSLTNCETGDLWTVLIKAKQDGINKTIADINGAMLHLYKPKRPVYTGVIGSHISREAINSAKTYAGATLFCADIRSGSIKLKGIHTYFSETGTVDVTIYDNLGTNHGTYQLNTEQNKISENDIEEITLPLHNKLVKNLEYYFVFSYDSNNKPLKNNCSCYCNSFKPYYNRSKPYVNEHKENQYGWAYYVMAGGITTDSLDFTNPNPPFSFTSDMNGLIVDVEFQCRYSEVLCRDNINYENNYIANTLAFTVLYNTLAIVMQRIATSPELNRDTLINNEQYAALIVEYEGRLNQFIGYVVNNIQLSTNDCWTCKDTFGAIRSGIFA